MIQTRQELREGIETTWEWKRLLISESDKIVDWEFLLIIGKTGRSIQGLEGGDRQLFHILAQEKIETPHVPCAIIDAGQTSSLLCTKYWKKYVLLYVCEDYYMPHGRVSRLIVYHGVEIILARPGPSVSFSRKDGSYYVQLKQ